MDDAADKLVIFTIGFCLGVMLVILLQPTEVCKRSTTPDKIEITKTDTLYYYKIENINIKH